MKIRDYIVESKLDTEFIVGSLLSGLKQITKAKVKELEKALTDAGIEYAIDTDKFNTYIKINKADYKKTLKISRAIK